jgi:hypothetical protein
VARSYDCLAQCLHTGGMATGLGYVNADQLRNMSRPTMAADASSCELSWALGDLLSLELWLQEFFRPTSPQVRMEVC